MLNTMLMSVSERTREFGVLRAFGCNRALLAGFIIGDRMVIGGAGALLGGVRGLDARPLAQQLGAD
jgi:putative ABC transport system permease protein